MRPTFLNASAAAALLCAACSVPTTPTTPANPPSDPPSPVPQTATSAPAAPSTTPTTPSTPSQASTPSSASTPSQASTPSSPSTPAPASPSAGDQPVATRPGSFNTHKVTAQLYPVRRSGDTATVDLYVTSQKPGETFMLFDFLSDGNTETTSKAIGTVDGIRLLDTTNKKAYLPAVTVDGSCVCSPDDANTLRSRSSVWVTVTFAAPPTTLTTVSVSVPSFGTFTDVPVV